MFFFVLLSAFRVFVGVFVLSAFFFVLFAYLLECVCVCFCVLLFAFRVFVGVFVLSALFLCFLRICWSVCVCFLFCFLLFAYLLECLF